MISTHHSVCPLDCPDTCSLNVTVEDGRVTKVDASARNPFTDGYICAKVRRYPEYMYSPLRILQPMKRTGAKGDGEFQPISWDAALTLIAEKWRAIIAQDGAEAILPYHYGGSSGVLGEDAMDARFFQRLGASELLKTICAAPTGAVSRLMYGPMFGVPLEDYVHAKTILLWGVNPSATNIHLMPILQAAQEQGASIAVVDPRRTATARRADLHLAPKPGTDVVLALSMIHHLIQTERVDRDFIAEHVAGFDALSKVAAQYPITTAASICDVDARDIEALVDAYAAASPAVVRCGWGVERNRNGGNAVRAVLALPAVAGKFGVRGGGYTMSLSKAAPIDREAVSRPDLRRRPVRQINMTQLGRVLTELRDPPIRSLFVYNANPVAVTPDQNRIIRGLKRDDLFTVVHDTVMTDTARYADLVLPAPSMLEQPDLHKAYGHYHMQYSEAVIAPLGEAMSNHNLFCTLAAAMGFAEPEFKVSAEELACQAIDTASPLWSAASPDDLLRDGISTPSLLRQGVVQFGNVFPATASGRVELMAGEMGPITYETSSGKFPLTLLSPASSKTINSIFGEFLLRDPRVSLNTADAAARGINEGDLVRVHNELGEVHVRASVGDTIRTGVASIPKGMWCASSRNGSSVTALVPDHLTDIGDGACFNDARVEVERL